MFCSMEGGGGLYDERGGDGLPKMFCIESEGLDL